MDIQKEREAFELNVSPVTWERIEYNAENNIYMAKSKYWTSTIVQVVANEIDFGWKMWQAAKAQAVPEGFVLVEKKNTEDWYLDEDEGMWMDHDGIDGSLCELGVGEVQAVEHKEYLITESNTLYAAKVWDYANDQVDCWQFFKTQEEAEKAAAYCKAKFNDEPIETQEQKG